MVCLDVDTRWNSTSMMLEVATIYESAFERMYVEDYNYEAFFKNNQDEVEGNNNNKNKKKKKKKVEGHPKFQDFANVKCLIQFLKIFYEVTIRISGSKYCTSNLFFIELMKIQEAIVELSSSDDLLTRGMATRMKEKYDNGFGSKV
ncbi:zinc finger BED domain-containing protein RICESLEEPER 1-like [Apium graveolens]|uniref:zinc finger BED domain-containing protein RICESLEEPER 1-like n=1 Tax=Apium graveolens TaxID=4045 RepID=UPI003D7B2230